MAGLLLLDPKCLKVPLSSTLRGYQQGIHSEYSSRTCGAKILLPDLSVFVHGRSFAYHAGKLIVKRAIHWGLLTRALSSNRQEVLGQSVFFML